MIFNSMFKTLVGKEVTVELKNDLSIRGKLHSVDQFLNVKLVDIFVLEAEKYPHMAAIKSCFVRGSVIRYIHLPPDAVNTDLLQEATRKAVQEQQRQQKEGAAAAAAAAAAGGAAAGPAKAQGASGTA